MTQRRRSKVNKLSEGLRRADLKDMIDNLFTIDQYQSKMGNDRDIIVLRFRAADKEPAVDLMEFIEKGYGFALDADMSSGEERDGKYSVFVELERTEDAPGQIKDLLNGLTQLCDQKNWRFRWYKDIGGQEVTEENIRKHVPLTPEEYDDSIEGREDNEIAEFFDQGALDSITLSEGHVIEFNKAFSNPLTAKLIAIGDYDILKKALVGAIELDESSRGQILVLNKYLGNYDINKIEGKFLIRNGDRAVILDKQKW
jgi:hypothetical protein